MLFDKLIPAEDRYREIEQMMTLPEIATDGKKKKFWEKKND